LSRIRALVFAFFAVLLTVGIAACGGGGSSSNGEDPQKVINETFSGKKDIHSGNLDLSFKVSAKGKNGGSFDAKLNGPFESQGKGKLGKFDLNATVSGSGSGQSISFSGGIASTGDKAFVNYKNTDYEVPSTTFEQFKSQLQAQSKSNSSQSANPFGKLGVSPKDWLTNLKNEGTEDVNGASTIHISADANISKAVDDLKKILSQAGNLNVPTGTQLPNSAQLDQLKKAVKTAHFDVFSGEKDKILRKIDVNLSIASSGSTADLAFSFGISDLNKPQTIKAPSGAKPLSELLTQLGIPGGLGALGGLGGASAGGSSSAGGAGGAPTGGPSSAQSQKYLACLQAAKDQAAIAACASQLSQ
jgi:hypothetical protein